MSNRRDCLLSSDVFGGRVLIRVEERAGSWESSLSLAADGCGG